MVGIIFVCDVCLEELIISQGDFDPIDLEEMVENAPNAVGWYIPELVGYCGEKDRYYEVATSNVRSLCPKHHFLKILERRVESKQGKERSMYYGWVIRRFVGKKRVPKYFTFVTNKPALVSTWEININNAFVFNDKKLASQSSSKGDEIIPIRLEVADPKYWLR